MKNTNNRKNDIVNFVKKSPKRNSSKSFNSLPLENVNIPNFRKSSSKAGFQDESIKSAINGGPRKNSKLKQKIKYYKLIKTKQSKGVIFDILSQEPEERNSQELLIVGDYLSKYYKYFINLKKNEPQLKMDKIAKICKLEKFKPDDIIILYGDIADKFYIVLEGLVEVNIPEYYEKEMTPYEYLIILDKIKKVDWAKYERIKYKNNGIHFDTLDIDKVDSNTNFMKSIFNFYLEKDDKKGDYGEGFSFGEIALIKKTTRNATIRAIDNTICLSISKNEYNEAMKEFESKKLFKEIDSFKQKYQFFNCINNERMIQIFNCFSKIVLNKGDYLYHQNDLNEYIYLVIHGNFEVFSYISYSWLNEYYDYVDDSLGNILFYMVSKSNLKYNELQDIIKCIKENITPSPMIGLEHILSGDFDMTMKKNMKDNLYFIKNDEEKINDNRNIFRIDLNKVDYNDIFGLEDSFDFKRKFYSVKCVSNTAELKCIKMTDLLRIIWNSKIKDYLYILKIIMNKKNILKNKIVNSTENLEKKILFGLDIRYENLINYEENIYNKKGNTPNNLCLKEKIENNFFVNKNHNLKKEKEINRVVSAIKVKGYKMSIQDILDKKIEILPPEKSNAEKKQFRINSAINSHILKNLLKVRKTNPHLFKFKRKTGKLINASESKDDSFLSSQITSKKITTNYTTYKNNNVHKNKIEFSGFSKDYKKDEEINNINLEKNIYKLNRTNNLQNSMQILDKILKSPNHLVLPSNHRNQKLFFHKDNNSQRNNRNIFNNKIINRNPITKLYSIERPRFLMKNKTHNFSAKNNMEFFKKSISINKSENLNQYISPRAKLEKKRSDIFSTIRKGRLINKVMENQSKNDESTSKEENIQKYIFNEKEKIQPIIKHKTFIKKKLSITGRKIYSQKDLRSSIFNK